MRSRGDGESVRPYRMTARAESAEQTSERILDAMLVRFASTPYERIRLDDVAVDAKVTTQTVIRRFGGKAQLMVAVAEREFARIAAARASAGEVPPASVLSALVEHYERYGSLILKAYSEAPLVSGLPELAAQGRAFHVAWCSQVFSSRLPLDGRLRARRLAQVVVICDATTWRILRFDGALSAAETEHALLELLEPLLGSIR